MEAIAEISEYELERGKPMPSFNHAKLQTRIASALIFDYDERFDVLTEPSFDLGRVVTPDVAVLPLRPSDWLNDQIRVTEPPLGVVEILSPTQSNQELLDKLNVYFDAGVKSCWIVVPMYRLINVFSDRNTFKSYQQGELYDEQLGVRLDVDKLFR